MKKIIKSFLKDESGVSALEYVVLAGAVGTAVAAVFGGTGNNSFQGKLTTKLNSALK